MVGAPKTAKESTALQMREQTACRTRWSLQPHADVGCSAGRDRRGSLTGTSHALALQTSQTPEPAMGTQMSVVALTHVSQRTYRAW